MDIREKTELTFEEAMLHLNRCFNKETFQKLYQAIIKENQRAK